MGFPSFDPFVNASGSGGTLYSPGSGLYHQTNAWGEAWSLWNGGQGSSSAEVACVNTNLSYIGFPAGFPRPPATNSVSLPGTAVDASGYSAAFQLSQPVTADPNNQVTNKVFASFLLQISSLGNLNTSSPIYFGGFATNRGDQNVTLPSRAMKIFLQGNNSTAGSSTAYSLGIQAASGSGASGAYDAGGHTASSILFVVIDYEFGINGGPDRANLWVNPSASTFGAPTPPATSATLTVAAGSSAQLLSAGDFFLLARTGATLWGSLVLGDLRVGGTWGFVTGGPEIVGSPANLTNPIVSTATFSVVAIAGATNSNPLFYQWQFQGLNLTNGRQFSGATGPVLSVSTLTPSTAGTYSVIVSNSVASLTNSATLTFPDPDIYSNPVSQSVLPGSSVPFSIAVTGTPLLTYQWRENGLSLSDGASATGTVFAGSRSASLQLENVSEGENGAVFDCAVTNGVGVGSTSAGASLGVGDPMLVNNPQDTSVPVGGSVDWPVAVVGTSPLNFCWQKNGQNLSNGVSASGSVISGTAGTNLLIGGVGYLDSGSYQIILTNGRGLSLTSAPAFLTVTPPSETNQIDDLNVKNFGATGNGSTDDTAAFLNAITAAQSGGHNGVYVPAGRYVISSTLTLSGLELIGNFAGGWPADSLPLPTLLLRQYAAPGIVLTNGASLGGLALVYDEQTPATSNAPAISLQSGGLTLEKLRIQNPYDAISTPSVNTPGRARMSDILILGPAHSGVQISKCYDFVQYKHIEVLCPGTMSTGPAFSFGRVDEGDYLGLVASNCAVGIQCYLDTASGGGDFTGTFSGCTLLGCGNSIVATGDHKIKVLGGDFLSLNTGLIVSGTNIEVTLYGGKWQAGNGPAVQVIQADNFIADACLFSRPMPLPTALVVINDSTTATVNASQFLPGSTGVELDSLLQRAIVTGNSFLDGGVSNYMTSSQQVVAGNLFEVSPPQNLIAQPGPAQIILSWAPSLGATSYIVERANVSGGPYSSVAIPATNGWTDANLTNWITYYYVVSAVKPSGQTGTSSEVAATPQPAPPGGLIATPGNAQVALAWSAVPGATSYNVQRGNANGGPYDLVVNGTSTQYSDSGLTNGVTYYYVVSAVTAGGQTANSLPVSATPQIPVPNALAGLIAIATNAQVSLTWQTSPLASIYYVYRALTSGGPYALLGATPLTHWTDAVVLNGTSYFYVVVAANSSGAGAPSAQVTALPQITVHLNANLNAAANQLLLTWPAWAAQLELYESTNLVPPILWLPVTNLVQSNQGTFSVILPVTNNIQQFFLLSPP